MNDAIYALIPIMALAIPLLAILVRSSVGQAIADAIRHNSGANEGAAARRELEQMRAEIDQLRVEVEDVRAQLLESHERLDFAERLLSQRNDPSQLPLHRTPV
jgi:multidrug resistance efflux pump